MGTKGWLVGILITTVFAASSQAAAGERVLWIPADQMKPGGFFAAQKTARGDYVKRINPITGKTEFSVTYKQIMSEKNLHEHPYLKGVTLPELIRNNKQMDQRLSEFRASKGEGYEAARRRFMNANGIKTEEISAGRRPAGKPAAPQAAVKQQSPEKKSESVTLRARTQSGERRKKATRQPAFEFERRKVKEPRESVAPDVVAATAGGAEALPPPSAGADSDGELSKLRAKMDQKRMAQRFLATNRDARQKEIDDETTKLAEIEKQLSELPQSDPKEKELIRKQQEISGNIAKLQAEHGGQVAAFEQAEQEYQKLEKRYMAVFSEQQKAQSGAFKSGSKVAKCGVGGADASSGGSSPGLCFFYRADDQADPIKFERCFRDPSKDVAPVNGISGYALSCVQGDLPVTIKISCKTVPGKSDELQSDALQPCLEESLPIESLPVPGERTKPENKIDETIRNSVIAI